MLFVATMLVCLSFGAALLLNQVSGVGQMTGASVRSIRTDKAAAAVLLQGCEQLEQLLYPAADNAISLAAIRALPALSADDPLCADGTDCSQWRLLREGVVSGSSGQTGRLAVTCSPNCQVDPAAVINFSVRALGAVDETGGHLVEATLQPNGG